MLKGLLSLLVKPNCPLCDRAAESSLCPWCAKQLQKMQRSHPERDWQGELPWFAWGNYGGILKRAIATLKYENHPELAQLLGFSLGKAWLESPFAAALKGAIVVPIPLHPRKLKQRGFNQAELIGRYFCQYTRLPLQPLGLERCKDTEAMFGLKASDRTSNVSEAFIVGKPFQKRQPNAPVLLVDDIYTTGATAHSAAQTLRQQGIKVAGMVVVARTIAQP